MYSWKHVQIKMDMVLYIYCYQSTKYHPDNNNVIIITVREWILRNFVNHFVRPERFEFWIQVWFNVAALRLEAFQAVLNFVIPLLTKDEESIGWKFVCKFIFSELTRWNLIPVIHKNKIRKSLKLSVSFTKQSHWQCYHFI